jgi:hypothetical protein
LGGNGNNSSILSTGNIVDSGTFEVDDQAGLQTISNNISGAGAVLVDGGNAQLTSYSTNTTNIGGLAGGNGNPGGAFGQNITSSPPASGGVVTFNGTQTYTGNTTVQNDSALNVVGTNHSSNIEVQGNSFLGGNGTITGNVDLSQSGFAPGMAQNVTFAPNAVSHGPTQGLEIGTTNLSFSNNTSFSTLTIDGNVTLAPQGSNNLFHLSSNATQNLIAVPNDQVKILGTLTNSATDLSSTIFFDFEDTGYFGASGSNTYVLITATNDLATQFSLSQFQAENVWNGGYGTLESYFSFGGIDDNELLFTVVPEPATWGLLAGGAMLLLGLRRKRKLALAAKSAANVSA